MFSRLFASLPVLAILGLASLAADENSRDLKAWVGQRVKAWEPTADERRFDQIGWVAGIREAERLAKEHDRPVFLFTHDGHMAVGRC